MYNSRRLLQFMAWQIPPTYSTIATRGSAVAESLADRSILRVSGSESYNFIQGLITNDVMHLESGSNAMYTMFLNSKGRVMYDAIIYRTSESSTLLVECDSSALAGLERHLKMFRLRKKISIEAETNLKVWAIFDPTCEVLNSDTVEELMIKFEENLQLSRTNGSPTSLGNILVCDPRVAQLGLRLVCCTSYDIPSILQLKKHSFYCALRYQLGIGEGINDLPPDNCFPLEANCDYLHGVSFHKGCYIGQELTARTHHTGVVRKRLMPISLAQPVNSINASKQDIVNEKQKPVGKVRGLEGTVGLGLMRISESLSAQTLLLGSTEVQTKRPLWWPKESPKDLGVKK